jgi:hypothetical protein
VARIIIPSASGGTDTGDETAVPSVNGVKVEALTCAPVTGASMETSSWIGSSAWKPSPVSVAVSRRVVRLVRPQRRAGSPGDSCVSAVRVPNARSRFPRRRSRRDPSAAGGFQACSIVVPFAEGRLEQVG